jgi:uncharacterized protein
MAVTTAPAPAPPRTRRGGRSRETLLYWIGLALIALHVVDDNYLQPQPGMSPGDHVVSGLVPLALLGLAAWAYPRLRGGPRGALALFLGPLGIAAGIEALYYTREVGPSGDDFSGLLAVPAGVGLLGLGAATLWRTRRRDGSLLRRSVRRTAMAAAGLVVGAFIVLPLGYAYVGTHVARPPVDAIDLGSAIAEDVQLRTSDDLTLEGTYVPSKNGAAVIVAFGRKSTQAPARMLARHGYGVLLFDRRGEGESDGDPNQYAWNDGERDLLAAIDFLKQRPDVEPGRIGGLGLSVGGESLLQTAARSEDLDAVVSEGAGARSVGELRSVPGSTWGPVAVNAVVTAGTAVFADAAPPPHLIDLVGRISPRATFLIYAPAAKGGTETRFNSAFYGAAGDPKAIWGVPDAGHVGGLEARPREYEERVTRFFDEHL